jgi:hypothetical protein
MKCDNEITLIVVGFQAGGFLVQSNLLLLRHYRSSTYAHYAKDHQRTSSIRQKGIEW